MLKYLTKKKIEGTVKSKINMLGRKLLTSKYLITKRLLMEKVSSALNSGDINLKNSINNYKVKYKLKQFEYNHI